MTPTPALVAAEAFAAAGHHSVLELFAGEHRRVLRPGGLVVYTARTTADAH
jgi:hypothetical protein